MPTHLIQHDVHDVAVLHAQVLGRAGHVDDGAAVEHELEGGRLDTSLLGEGLQAEGWVGWAGCRQRMLARHEQVCKAIEAKGVSEQKQPSETRLLEEEH